MGKWELGTIPVENHHPVIGFLQLTPSLHAACPDWLACNDLTRTNALSRLVVLEGDLKRLVKVTLGSQQPGLEQRAKRATATIRAPHRIFKRSTFRFENMVGEHVPHGPGALSLETAKQVIELQCA